MGINFYRATVPFFLVCSPNYHLEMAALVQRPAPTFKAEAVIEGLFLDVSLADYLGQWYVDDILHTSAHSSSIFLDA